MPGTNLRTLVTKLNPTCRKALEAAAGFCLSRTNYHVEIEHWLLKLLDDEDTDLARTLRHFDVDPARLNRELTRVLDQMRTGNGRSPDMSVEVIDLMRAAWNQASLDYGANVIRSGYLLSALLSDRQLALRAGGASAELAKIPAAELREALPALMQGSSDDEAAAAPGDDAPAPRPGDPSKTPSLDQYTLNLTERAQAADVDPVVGRDAEIRQVIDVLTRRRQNNPILTGEAGVGKTAVVEGFALRVVHGDVPGTLRDVEIRTLDLGLLQAGAGVKGEFENRLKSVIAEVKASPKPIILFIDEAHTLMGAGAPTGQGDAANLLKPALARGELRTVAATTWAEYKKSFETDPALKRRFQVVKVEEPGVETAVEMLRAVAPTLEKHHRVRVMDDALEHAVKLSSRYIPDRQLPDKAVSLLDTACARVALSQSSTPAACEDERRRLESLEAETAALKRERAVGHDCVEPRLEELRREHEETTANVARLEERWHEEQRLADRIRQLRTELERRMTAPPTEAQEHAPDPDAEGEEAPPQEEDAAGELAEVATAELQERLRGLERELVETQGPAPLVFPVVDRQSVADVVANWTGIPVGKMVVDEIRTVLSLGEKLQGRVIGQSHALDAVAKRIQTSRASLADPQRPVGVFLLVGPSGVGKTETAVALADVLYGGERNMVVINMSEYKEEHKISRLTGSAPGYVGYGEGGVLTEAVRRKPYSIVLLDEVEKAHPSVQEIFYQVFDKGMLQDDKGTAVDFRNTILLLTSNAAGDTVTRLCADPDTRPNPSDLEAALHPELLKVFKPALLGRMNVVPYYPLSDDVLRRIIAMRLDRVAERFRENHQAELACSDAVVDAILSRCREVETGARNADHIITGTVLPALSQAVLTRIAEGRAIGRARVDVADGEFTYAIDDAAAPVPPLDVTTPCPAADPASV